MQYCYFSLHFPPFPFFLFWSNMGYTYIFSPQLFLTSPVFGSSFTTVASGIGWSWWLNTSRSSKELTTNTHIHRHFSKLRFRSEHYGKPFVFVWLFVCSSVYLLVVVLVFWCFSGLCFIIKTENKGLIFDPLKFVMLLFKWKLFGINQYFRVVLFKWSSPMKRRRKLRDRGHDNVLPLVTTERFKRCFINRCLFNFI